MTTDDRLLDELRPRAFAIAYRMLGSVAEAEDVVQEALLRVHGAMESGERIASPLAFVAKVTTRLAIDELRSARARRESYVGDWLPEPLVSGPADETLRRAEMANSLSLAFLVVLESLSPEQRAALLLRDVFDYEYHEVAAVIGTSETNARQLAARARRNVAERRPRFEASREQRNELAQRFFAAAIAALGLEWAALAPLRRVTDAEQARPWMKLLASLPRVGGPSAAGFSPGPSSRGRRR